MECTHILKSGKQCGRNAKEGSIYCWQHDKIEHNNEIKTVADAEIKAEIYLESKNAIKTRINTFFDTTKIKTSNRILKNSQTIEFVKSTVRNLLSKDYKLTYHINGLLYQIADYLFESIKNLKTKEDYINYIESTFIPNPKVRFAVLNIKTFVLKVIEENDSNIDTLIIKDILCHIIIETAGYHKNFRDPISYLAINQAIANDSYLGILLGDLIVPIKYTRPKTFHENVIARHVIKDKIRNNNLKMSEDVVIFIQQYIYWNFENLDKDLKLIIFGNSDISIKNFFNEWFDIMLPLFSQIKDKIDYKKITDLILNNDMFLEYSAKANSVACGILVGEISTDVVNNIFNGYL